MSKIIINVIDQLKPGSEIEDQTDIEALEASGAVFVDRAKLPDISIANKFFKRGDFIGAVLCIQAIALKGLLDSSSNPPDTVSYVCFSNGSDTNGQRGRIDKPFKTINAAISASQLGDTIKIAPGDYPGIVVPQGKVLCFIAEGDSENLSVRINGESGYALDASLGGTDSLSFENIVFFNSTTQPAAFVRNSSTSISDIVVFRDCKFYSGHTNDLQVQNVKSYVLNSNCEGKLLFQDCQLVRNEDFISGKITVQISSSPPSGIVQGISYFKNCNADGDIVLSGNLNAYSIGRIKCAEFTSLNVNPSSIYNFSIESGSLKCSTSVAGNPTLNFEGSKISSVEFTNGSTSDLVLNLNNSEIGGLNLAALSTGRIKVNAFNTKYDIGSSFMDSLCAVERNGGAFTFTLPSGASRYDFSNVGTASLPDFSFDPSSVVIYSASCNTVPVLPTDRVTITSGDPNGFDITNGYATDVDVFIVYTRQPSLSHDR